MLVSTNPELIGKTLSQVQLNVATMTAAVGAGFVTINTGLDTNVEYRFGHNGTVQVKLEPLSKPAP